MKYPVMAFKENDKLVYAFANEDDFERTNLELLESKIFNNTIVIDAIGKKFRILSAVNVGWANAFLGYSLLKKGRQIKVNFNLDELGQVSLEQVKVFLLERLRNNSNYYLNEVKELINDAADYKDLYKLFY